MRQKEALYRLTDQLQYASSLEEICAVGLDIIRDALRCERAAILLRDDEGVMRFVAWRGLSDHYRKAVDGHSPWAADERSPMPLCIEDIERADLGAALKETIRSEGIAAVGFYPLIGSAGLMGKFMTYSNGPRAYGVEEIGLSLTIARQLVVAIERKRADEALRAELADTQLLQRISSALIDPANVASVYDKVIDAAVSIMHSDCASMQMLYPERGPAGELRLLASRGFDPEAARFWEWVGLASHSTCGEALRTRQRVMVRDIEQCDYIRSDDLAAYAQCDIRAVQTTPLVSRTGRLVGMISTHWRQPHTPSERDLRLLDILARQATDLIERVNADHALAHSEAKLREDDRRKDEFLAMLAHELRNPLAPIMNAVQLLGRGGADARTQQHARGIIERQGARLARLVDDLLEVSRITSGRIQLHSEHITLAGVVERAVETARPLILERRHVLALRVPAEPIWLHADATRLEQVLVNLLNNACKYTDEGGSIELEAEATSQHVIVRVRDNGMGIDPDLLPRVFELFTQGKRALDRASGGLGIGLALVRKLVEMHGGTVVADSKPGRGSEFTVRLPAARPNPGWRPEQALSPAHATGAALRALVVDDNFDSAESFGMLLEAAGHDVKLAGGGELALDIAAEYRPHVVFLDIGLPGVDGYEVARRFRQDASHRSVCLIAMTGYGQSADRERAYASGFDHHLVKPVDFALVEAIVADIPVTSLA